MAIDVRSKDEPDLRSEAECFPLLDPGIEVAGDRVLVQLRREKTTSKGGIILVDETKQTLRFNETVAKVIQIGPLAYRSPDTLEPWPEGPWCKVGDFITFGKYSGLIYKGEETKDGKEYRVINDLDVVATHEKD